jgi:hypothetical protein
MVGAWLCRALRREGHDESCPYLGSPCGERLTPASAYPFSPQFSPQRSPPFSHPFCHLPSVIDSVIDAGILFGWQVAAPGGRWRGFSIQPSIQSSTQSSTQSFLLPSVIPHFRCQVTATGASGIQGSAVSLRQPAPGSSCRHLRFPNRQPLTANRWHRRQPIYSALHSVLHDRFSHLPSVIDSVLSGRFAAVHSAAVNSRCSWNRAWKLSA